MSELVVEFLDSTDFDTTKDNCILNKLTLQEAFNALSISRYLEVQLNYDSYLKKTMDDIYGATTETPRVYEYIENGLLAGFKSSLKRFFR